MSKPQQMLAVVAVGRPPQKITVTRTTGKHLRPNNPEAVRNFGCKFLGGIIAGEKFPPRDGGGDLVSNALKAVGITKERWANLVGTFKTEYKPKAGGCGGCDARQKFLNWAGKAIGLSEGKGPELQAVLEMQTLPTLPVYACEIHGKCLPLLNVNETTAAQLVAGGWHGCGRCPDKVLKLENPENETA